MGRKEKRRFISFKRGGRRLLQGGRFLLVFRRQRRTEKWEKAAAVLTEKDENQGKKAGFHEFSWHFDIFLYFIF